MIVNVSHVINTMPILSEIHLHHNSVVAPIMNGKDDATGLSWKFTQYQFVDVFVIQKFTTSIKIGIDKKTPW